MQIKQDKFLDKIVKKDYNNEIEEVLENKKFDETAKNLLLSILYKIEASYKDYEIVKIDVDTKEKYMEKIISTIKNDCNMIKTIKNNEENSILKDKTFLVDKTAKEIICLPIERKLLYGVAKITKKDKIIKDKYIIINETLSNTINIGNNINMVEPFRDFNGFSWTTIPTEIESIEHNLIYQILLLLVGNKFLNNWIEDKEYIIDYLEEFKNKLDIYYGEENSEEFIYLLYNLSFLLDIKTSKKQKSKFEKEKKEVEELLEKVNNKEQYIIEISKKKKDATDKIEKSDKILSNKELLEKEYIKRNKDLPLKEKIFSIRVLSEILKKERESILNEIEEYNISLRPQNYIKTKAELDEKERYLKLLDIKNKNQEIDKLLLNMQKNFLKCFNEKIKKVNTRQEIINLIYSFRYYNLLPYNKQKLIYETKELQKELKNTQKELIKKAIDMKCILNFSKEDELNYNIIKNILKTRVISLEEIYIKITKEKNKFYLQLFDENIFEEKIEIEFRRDITKKDFEIKLNKKIKLFD